MKYVIGLYLLCVAAAALTFAIFPAEDTYVSPVEVRPVERVVETRVVEATPDVTTINQQIDVNVKDITAIEQRMSEIQRFELVESEDVDRRIKDATDTAVRAATHVDTLWKKIPAMEEQERSDNLRALIRDAILGALFLGFIILAIFILRKRAHRIDTTTYQTKRGDEK